jgi:NMD protein affecting ribosome stability and mRNA decay
MIVHFCDKCGEEIKAPFTTIGGKELCDNCTALTEKWIEAENDMKLGFPSERGFYLVTIRFNDGERSVRMARYTGSPVWFKAAKDSGIVEENGIKVIAWAELPEPYAND